MRHPVRRTHLHQLCMRWKRRGVGFWHAEPPVENVDCGAESSAKPREDAFKIFKRRVGASEKFAGRPRVGQFGTSHLKSHLAGCYENATGKEIWNRQPIPLGASLVPGASAL